MSNTNDNNGIQPIEYCQYDTRNGLLNSLNDKTPNGNRQELLQDPDTPQATQGRAQVEHVEHSNGSHAIELQKSSLSTRAAPRAQFLHDLPPHDYTLPLGPPVNATLAEIIAILPNWFRNIHFASRFQNNGITSGIQLAILDKHRDLQLTNASDVRRARDHISDQYRKTMRLSNPNWKKADHVAPRGWNPQLIYVNHFTPDANNQCGFSPPPAIPFKDLANGLKKLPTGYDAGDLTYALEYAMQNQGLDNQGNLVDYMFPTDIHVILDHIGRIEVTHEHTDLAIVGRYCNAGRNVGASGRGKKDQAQQVPEAPSMSASQAYYSHLVPMLQVQGTPSPTTPPVQPISPPPFSFASLADDYLDPSFANMKTPYCYPTEVTPQQILHYEGDDQIFGIEPEPRLELWGSISQDGVPTTVSEHANQWALDPSSPGDFSYALANRDSPDFGLWANLPQPDTSFPDPTLAVDEMDALMSYHQFIDFSPLLGQGESAESANAPSSSI